MMECPDCGNQPCSCSWGSAASVVINELRARLAEVEAERDKWKALADEAAPVAVAAMKAEARAEQAEWERDGLADIVAMLRDRLNSADARFTDLRAHYLAQPEEGYQTTMRELLGIKTGDG